MAKTKCCCPTFKKFWQRLKKNDQFFISFSLTLLLLGPFSIYLQGKTKAQQPTILKFGPPQTPNRQRQNYPSYQPTPKHSPQQIFPIISPSPKPTPLASPSLTTCPEPTEPLNCPNGYYTYFIDENGQCRYFCPEQPGVVAQ